MSKRFNPDVDVAEWTGRQRPYDIIKEGTIAVLVVAVLVIGLAVVFGSPDDKPVTIKQWSHADPIDFATTAFSELQGTSGVAQYGAPYNHVPGTGQDLIGSLSLVNLVGVHIPIKPAEDFIIRPLASQPDQPALTSALRTWESAPQSRQAMWLAAYAKAEPTTFANGHLVITATNAGPVPQLMQSITSMARTGALDQALLSGGANYYSTNYTKPLLFLADGSYFANLAQKQHLLGTQWGMMNETGSYPGQAWLWLYTFWYQVSPFSSSASADAQVWGVMMLLSVLLIFVPFIPGLRSIPRRVRIYRLIWRDHYRHQ